MEESSVRGVHHSSRVVIVTNGSGNGHNGILGILTGGHLIVNNLGLIGHRAGPGPVSNMRNNVIRGRTPLSTSGITVFGNRAGGTSHINFGMRSNGGVHIFGSARGTIST